MAKQNAPQYHDETNKQIWEALDAYFAQAGDDNHENARLIGSAIKKWGYAVALAGFAWLAERIEREGIEASKLAVYGSPSALLSMRVIIISRDFYNKLKDIVNAFGVEAGQHLGASISPATPDEDELAFVAYMLSDGFHETLRGAPREAIRLMAENVLHHVVGTSCQMAISWLIFQLGNHKPWEALVYGDYFVQKRFVETWESSIKKAMKLSTKEVREKLCREYAIPGSTNLPDLIVPDKKGVFELLVLDLASKGALFHDFPKWTRKQVR